MRTSKKVSPGLLSAKIEAVSDEAGELRARLHPKPAAAPSLRLGDMASREVPVWSCLALAGEEVCTLRTLA